MVNLMISYCVNVERESMFTFATNPTHTANNNGSDFVGMTSQLKPGPPWLALLVHPLTEVIF